MISIEVKTANKYSFYSCKEEEGNPSGRSSPSKNEGQDCLTGLLWNLDAKPRICAEFRECAYIITRHKVVNYPDVVFPTHKIPVQGKCKHQWDLDSGPFRAPQWLKKNKRGVHKPKWRLEFDFLNENETVIYSVMTKEFQTVSRRTVPTLKNPEKLSSLSLVQHMIVTHNAFSFSPPSPVAYPDSLYDFYNFTAKTFNYNQYQTENTSSSSTTTTTHKHNNNNNNNIQNNDYNIELDLPNVTTPLYNTIDQLKEALEALFINNKFKENTTSTRGN